MYFDDLMFFRTNFADAEFDALGSDLKIVLRLSARISDTFQLDAKEDELLCYRSVARYDVGATRPMLVFALHPPSATYPLRLILMTLELTAHNRMHVIFGGNTKPFQAEFFREEITLEVQKTDSATYAESVSYTHLTLPTNREV